MSTCRKTQLKVKTDVNIKNLLKEKNICDVEKMITHFRANPIVDLIQKINRSNIFVFDVQLVARLIAFIFRLFS